MPPAPKSPRSSRTATVPYYHVAPLTSDRWVPHLATISLLAMPDGLRRRSDDFRRFIRPPTDCPQGVIDVAEYVDEYRRVTIAGYLLRRARKHYCEIEEVVVDAAHRRQGVGRMLLANTAALLTRPGLKCRSVYLRVPEGTAWLHAHLWLKACGWRGEVDRAAYAGDDDMLIFELTREMWEGAP